MIQAAIASLHVDEPRGWDEIAALYGELARITRSPVVELNQAAALAEAGNPAGALQLIERLPLESYRYFHSTKAEVLVRLGRAQEAGASYERALALVHDESERRLFERRLAALRDDEQPAA